MSQEEKNGRPDYDDGTAGTRVPKNPYPLEPSTGAANPLPNPQTEETNQPPVRQPVAPARRLSQRVVPSTFLR